MGGREVSGGGGGGEVRGQGGGGVHNIAAKIHDSLSENLVD